MTSTRTYKGASIAAFLLILTVLLNAQTPARLILPVGHFFGVDMIEVSRTEKHLVTHDINNNILLWEVSSKKELLRIESGSKVTAIVFFGESSIVYFVKDSLYEYNIISGRSSGYKTKLNVRSARCVDNGIYLISTDDNLYFLDRSIKNAYRYTLIAKSISDVFCNLNQAHALTKTGTIIELNGLKQVNKYTLKADLDVIKLAKQAKGETFCLAEEDGSVWLFNASRNTYKEIYKFSEAVTGLVFSKDDKRVIACSNDFATISYHIDNYLIEQVMLNDYCTSLQTLRDGSIIVGCYDGNIYQFNSKLKKTGAFTSALEKPTIHRYISKDILLLGKDDGSILQIDLEKNRKFQMQVASARISDIIKSSRSNEIIIGSYDGKLYRYDLQLRNISTIRTFSSPVVNIEYCPTSHNYLVLDSKSTYLFDSAFNLLDSSSSKDAWFVNKSDQYFTTGGTGEFIYADNSSNKITNIHLPDSLKAEWVAEVHHSQQDDLFYIGTYGGKIIKYKTGEFELVTDFNENLHHLYFNRKENTLYAVIKSNKVYQIALNKVPSVRLVFKDSTLDPDNTWNIDFDEQSSKYLVASGRNIHIFDDRWNATQQPLVFSDLVCVAPDSRYSAQFSPDSKGIVSLCYDGSYHWNPLQNNKYGTDTIPFLQTSQIGQRLKITPREIEYNNYRYKITTGKNRWFEYLQLDNDDWLVYDDAFHFDGTENARKLLYFTCGTEVVALDQLKDQLWVPNLAERLATGDSIGSKSLDQLDICGRTPEITEIDHSDSLYQFLITPRKGGLGKVDLLVNGIEVKRYDPSQLKKTKNGVALTIARKEVLRNFVSDKPNTVAVKAYTSDNAVFSRGFKIEEDSSSDHINVLPNLYAVMVGVSDYKGKELDLKYAAKDAQDLGAALQTASRKLLNVDGKEHVFMYDLNTSTSRSQLPEKNRIQSTLEEIGKKAQPNDILLIFFAGHGVMEGSPKQFYFLTADASPTTATEAVRDVGISTDELAEWMKPQNIRAQKRILIFDACNSGQAIKDLIKIGGAEQGYLAARGDDQSQLIKAIDKLNERSGLFILSASASNQPAYEMGRYSQGILTYALLKAVKQQPDILDQGKYLDLSRWFQAAERTVTEMSRENNARQQPQIVSNTNFNIGLVDDIVRDKINLPQEKPVFLSSSIQNADEMIAYDDREMGKWIDAQFLELASTGNDSKITFMAGARVSNAWTLTGRYEVAGDNLKIKINLRLGSGAPKHRFELSGNVDKLKELANQITEKAIALEQEENRNQNLQE